MAKYEANVKVDFGELSIGFDKTEDLDSSLAAIDIAKVSELMMGKLGTMIKREPRKPKPGFEDVYRFADEGTVELLLSTNTNIDAIGLSLFAYDPIPASAEQISWSSGVEDPDALIRQPQYKKYFMKSSGHYLLSREGKAWVSGDIIPTLGTKQRESEQ